MLHFIVLNFKKDIMVTMRDTEGNFHDFFLTNQEAMFLSELIQKRVQQNNFN